MPFTGKSMGTVIASGHTAVLQMETLWAAIFLASWVWLQKRRRLQNSAPGGGDKKGAYVPMDPVPSPRVEV